MSEQEARAKLQAQIQDCVAEIETLQSSKHRLEDALWQLEHPEYGDDYLYKRWLDDNEVKS